MVITIFFKKIRRTLGNERGEANYFSTVVFIFIAILLLAFIIDLFSIISTKQELDHCADQMVKQIQLSGGVNRERQYPYYRIYIKNYVIFYVVLGNVMEVRRIVYSRRNLPEQI